MRREYKSQLCGSVKEKKEQCEREREDETFYTEKKFYDSIVSHTFEGGIYWCGVAIS